MSRINNLHISPLPGGGPWRILDNCPADRHNTLYAAVKGGRRGPGNARCICPRALQRKQDDLDSRRGEHARWYQKNKARLKAAKVVDRPALKPLPASPYVLAEWRIRRVSLDYHVEVEKHYYSVPHRFVRAEVEVRFTARTVEIFHKGERIVTAADNARGGGGRSQTNHINITPPAGMSKQTASQLGATIARQLAMADRRNN